MLGPRKLWPDAVRRETVQYLGCLNAARLPVFHFVWNGVVGAKKRSDTDDDTGFGHRKAGP